MGDRGTQSKVCLHIKLLNIDVISQNKENTGRVEAYAVNNEGQYKTDW